MAKINVQEFLESLKEMTVLELNELVKAIEEEFGVTAAAVVATAGAGEAAAAEEGPSTVVVILAGVGANKIAVIKVVRELTGLQLIEAKDLVDGERKQIKEGVFVEEVVGFIVILEEVVESVELKLFILLM